MKAETTATTSTAVNGRQVALILVGLMLGMLIAALDQTIVATALPTIAGDLYDLSHLSWVVTAYLVALTASMPCGASSATCTDESTSSRARSSSS